MFEELLRISLFHGYFANTCCPYVRLRPDDSTLKTLKNLGLRSRVNDNGLSIYAKDHLNETSGVPTLQFTIAGDGALLELAGEVSPGWIPNESMYVFRPIDSVSMSPIELMPEGARLEEALSFEHQQASGWGVIIVPAELLVGPTLTKLHLRIPARRPTWRYLIRCGDEHSLAEYRIETSAKIDYFGAPHNLIGEDKNVWVFQSTQELLLAERPSVSEFFQLIPPDKSPVAPLRLPRPGLRSLRPERVDGKVVMIAEIFQSV